jgi:hypothetical protein
MSAIVNYPARNAAPEKRPARRGVPNEKARAFVLMVQIHPCPGLTERKRRSLT